jgi:phosphoketolase
MTIVSVFEAVAYLQTEGIAVQIVSLINLRRLYSPHDNPWNTCTEPDRSFWDEAVM